jgi:tetratricopeptide (TPR) repeat protein
MILVQEAKYIVSDNVSLFNDLYGITPAIHDKLNEMYDKVKKKKKGTEKELKALIEKHPQIPRFKNLLVKLTELQGNVTKAFELNHWIVKEHPEYLYGKLNLAFEYIAQKQYEKVPELLGSSLELSELYPHRNEFHFDEVLSYHKAALLYFIKTNNLKKAERRFELMKDIDAESHHTEFAAMQIMAFRLEKGIERMKRENEGRRRVTSVSAKVADDTDEMPKFNHEIIEQLYCHSMRIPHAIIAEILSLPKDSLLHDLHSVIYDSIARFKYFHDHTTFDYVTHEFLTHALFIIAELQSPGSLPVVLNMLRQDEEYLEYWFGDFLTDVVEECLFSICLHQTDTLLSFLKEPDRHIYARSVVADTMAQIALHYPERRHEVIEWYKSVFEFFISNKDDDRVIETDLTGLMVWRCLDIGATELMPVIEILYKENLAGISMCGDWEDVKESFSKSDTENKKKERRTIYEQYNYILSQWYHYSSKKDLQPKGELDNEELQEDDNKIIPFSSPGHGTKNILPFSPQPKVGRNEPCTCGSGKKYKKCCGKG